MKGFVRVAAITPRVSVANPQANAEALLEGFREAVQAGAQVVVAPELCLTGCTCADLFGTASLEAQTAAALDRLCRELPSPDALFVVGLPVRWEDRLFNCAAVLQAGKVLGLVPKTCLPNNRSHDEKRYFVSGREVSAGTMLRGVPFGVDLLFDAGAFRFGIEIGDDLRAVVPPSCALASARAQLILNPAAYAETVGSAVYRQDLVRTHSARLACAYASSAAGEGESTADAVYAGHRLLANGGRLLASAQWETGLSLMDFAPAWIDIVRQRETAFADLPRAPFRRIDCRTPSEGAPAQAYGLFAGLEANPFVPEDAALRTERCREILRIQCAALVKRFTHTHAKRFVLGLSGGLDSTLALLVCVDACRQLGVPPTAILGVTMPGFGTTRRTRGNVDILAGQLGIELREVPIGPAVTQHFADIAHDPAVRDVTYENAQARERTQILMDLANQENGLLVGTGDLSEIALGWCTYNGDHMSMYSVNCGVSKALVRHCVETVALDSPPPLAAALRDICATPVSPELVPGGTQHTEAIVGEYDLHDFFLYCFIKYGADRETLEALAALLLGGRHSAEAIRNALDIFCRRFVQQQFKRAAAPDGPKVGSIALSARGDWRMPSDADFRM